jgi:SAM-dependent methyltransferase
MPTGAYSMQIGDADARRLQLLGQFYDPMSSAFLEAAGVRPGDTVADLGCGHGGVTERIAARVGDAGQVYAVDASPDQLRVARTNLADRPNVTFVQSSLEDDPLRGQHVDWVYSRFLLMHVRDLDRALNAMADMITEDGALLLEIADVGRLTFFPANTNSDLWRPWWYSLGKTRGPVVRPRRPNYRCITPRRFRDRAPRPPPTHCLDNPGQTRARPGIRTMHRRLPA